MTLNSNPFFLLRIPCTAGRREIVSAAEEMSFILDSESCSNAQNELINMNKRLSAEINWFLDTDEKAIDSIRTSIENNEPISTDGLSPLSTLNAVVYNFSLTADVDPFELGYSVMEIDKKFSALKAEDITEAINQNRSAAKLSSVQVQDVSIELGKKREEIRRLITAKMPQPDQGDTYVELITRLAEKCFADGTFDDGVIISDVIDHYEVRMQSALEKSKEEIETYIDIIKKCNSSSVIDEELNYLICAVTEWDKLAQPLQLKSRATGIPHQMSENIGSELRTLSVYLHNEMGLTNEALTLVNALKAVFAELDILSDQFESDSSTLNDLLKRKTEPEEIVKELNVLQKEAENIKSVPSQVKINDFVTRIKKLNQRLKAFDMDAEAKTKVRENLCLLGRGTAIELHNAKHQTAYALTIAKALVEEFGDLTSLKAKLNEDVTTLNQQLLLSDISRTTTTYSPNRSSSASNGSSSSKGKGWIFGLLVFVGIIIFAVSSSHNGSSTKSTTSSYNRSTSTSTTKATVQPTTKPTTTTEKLYSASSAVGDRVYLNISLIEPQYGVYTSKAGQTVPVFTMYSDYVCKCTTVAGNTVWISFDAASYKSRIDSTIDTYVSSTVSGFSGERVRFSPSAKLHGTVVKSTSVMSGLDTKINQTSIIEYSSIDIPKQTINQTTTISIKTIFPSYSITSESSNNVTHVLCEYTDSLGEKNWIYMSVSEYKKYFDSSANPATDAYANEKKFTTAKKVTVTTKYADDLISGASSTIGQKTLFVFSDVN